MTVVFIIITAAAIAYGLRRLSLHFKPYTSTCWFCKGKGRMRGSTTARHGPCPFCKGKPRLRRGAKG